MVAGWRDLTKTEILEQRQAGLSHSFVVSGGGGVRVGWGAWTSWQLRHRPGQTPQTAPFFPHKSLIIFPLIRIIYTPWETKNVSMLESTKKELEIF